MKLLQAHMIDLLVFMCPESNKYPLTFFCAKLKPSKNSYELRPALIYRRGGIIQQQQQQQYETFLNTIRNVLIR